MKMNMKKLFRIFAVVLIIALVLNDYRGGLSTKAAETADGQALLSGIKIKNQGTNTEISAGNKITATDQLLVEYYLNDLYPLGSSKNVSEGTTYYFSVPDELKVLSGGTWTLRAGQNTVGTCSYDSSSHKIQLTFDTGFFDANGFAADGVTGAYIGFTACLDADDLGSQDNQSLTFKIAGGDYTFSFEYGEDAKASKSGVYDDDSETITWTISVDEGSKAYDKVMLKDSFSNNQKYVNGSLKEKIGDNGAFVACSNVTVSGNTISYEFVPNGTTRTFTYETKFTDEALDPSNAVNEKINLTATNNASIVDSNNTNKEIANTGEATVTATVTVESQYPSTVILDKVGKWHVREDNGLLWHVDVNEAKQTFGNDVYLIETIGGANAQTGDIEQVLGDNPIRNVKVNNQEATAEQIAKITIQEAGAGFKSNEYKISFGDLLDGNHVEFDFFTLMSEDEIEFYQGNNQTEELARNGRNTVTMYQTNTVLKSVDAIVRAYPKVLDKTFENYNYGTRELEWKIDVNYDFMKLDDVVLEDSIQAGTFADKVIVKTYENGDSTYATATTQLTDTPNQAGMYYQYNQQTKLLTITLGDIPRNTKYDVLVYSVLDPEDEINDNGTIKTLSNYNGTIELSNKVTMKKTGSSPVTVEATGTIDNKVLEKTGKVTGAGVASYEIKLNQAQMEWPRQSEVIDIMSPGMMLDVASIQLYEASVAEDGTMTATQLVDKDAYQRKQEILDAGNLEGEAAGSTKLTVVLPQNAGNKAYILKYDTILEEDTTYDKFTNKVSLQGVTNKETNTDTQISAQDLRGYGGATVINYSKVKIVKQNEDQEVLEGAEFALFLNGEEVDRKTTDENGEIIFSYLTPDAIYTIKEMKAPVGYVKDDSSTGTWQFIAKAKGDKYYLDNPHVFVNKKEEVTTEDTTTTTEEVTTEDTTTTTEEVTTENTTTTEDGVTTENATTDSNDTTQENTTTEGSKGDGNINQEGSKTDGSTTDGDKKQESNKDSGPQTGDNEVSMVVLLFVMSLAMLLLLEGKKLGKIKNSR